NVSVPNCPALAAGNWGGGLSAALRRLFLAEDEVERPATADVWAGRAQVGEDGLVGAAGILQRVGQDGELGETPLVVDRFGDPHDGATVPGQPRPEDENKGERGEEVAEKVGLGTDAVLLCRVELAPTKRPAHDSSRPDVMLRPEQRS